MCRTRTHATAQVDLSPTLGFTQFWAGSHKVNRLIGFGSAAQVLRGAVGTPYKINSVYP